MKLPRRKFLHLAAGAAAVPALSRIAMAQAYPARPVRIVVGGPPGGSADITARLIGQSLSERLGQPVIIENRPGSGANIAGEAFMRAPSDGYTLLLASTANSINATLYEKASFDFIRDIAPVAGIVRYPLVMVVNPSIPTKTVPEFIAYAKANPGRLNMGSSGIGTTSHVAGELFKMMTGINMVHVPYRGGAPALTGLLGGQVQVLFADISSIEYIKAGKLRALAVTTATRSEALSDVPTVAQFVPGFEASSWFGLGARRNTPSQIIGKLNREANASLADSKIEMRFVDLGGTVLTGSSADFGRLMVEDTEKWGKVIRTANIKAE